ncbi:hypothetical protein Aperf_G00000074997 [Anoplocephala perfoliata]
MTEDWETPDAPVKIVKNWEAEAQEVPDSWDIEEKPEEIKPKAPATKKTTAKEKKAAKEGKKQKVVEELLSKESEADKVPLTELEREELSKEEEYNLIKDSFGVVNDLPPPANDFDFSRVTTKQDFIDLSNKLVEKFKKLEISPHYSSFAEGFIRQISLQMDLENLKELSTAFTALINEKQKLSKPKGKKKAPKAGLVVERNIRDYDEYEDDVGDDYEDFL